MRTISGVFNGQVVFAVADDAGDRPLVVIELGGERVDVAEALGASLVEKGAGGKVVATLRLARPLPAKGDMVEVDVHEVGGRTVASSMAVSH